MSIIAESTLQEAALQLLASSTSQRYAREAARIAEESGLVAASKGSESTQRSYVERLAELLPTVMQSEGSPEEIEVALLLCALARSADEPIVQRLRELVQPNRMRSPWLAALAMRIPQFGPPMSSELDELRRRLEGLLQGSVDSPPSLDMRDNEDPRLFPRAA
jgi:hypothetical protein